MPKRSQHHSLQGRLVPATTCHQRQLHISKLLLAKSLPLTPSTRCNPGCQVMVSIILCSKNLRVAPARNHSKAAIQKEAHNLWCCNVTRSQNAVKPQNANAELPYLPSHPADRQTSIPFRPQIQPPHSLGRGLRCMTGFSTVSQAGPASVRFRGEVRAMLSSAVYTSPSARPKAEFRA